VVTTRRAIPFKTLRVNDSTLSKGSTKVRNPGARGVETLTYKVTFRNGIQTHKELVRKVIVRAPVTRVIAVGIKETQQCDPNYSGACVPIASDVDCAGGSGNGPPTFKDPFRWSEPTSTDSTATATVSAARMAEAMPVAACSCRWAQQRRMRRRCTHAAP
jgi:G5 domain